MASASSSLICRYRPFIRSSLVLKYVNRVPSATPACLDISDVGAAVRPRSANTRVAASRIAFRLSSLLGRATEFLCKRYIYSILSRKNAGGNPTRRSKTRIRTRSDKSLCEKKVINEHPVIHSIILCRGGYCNGEGLVDYGKRKRVGTGNRRGGAARGRQRRSRSASHGGTGTVGGAVRRAGETGQAGSAR